MPTITGQSCGDRLRYLRQERGLSLETLAGRADISPLALSNLELRDSVPRRLNLLRLLDTLEVSHPLRAKDRKAILWHFGYLDWIKESELIFSSRSMADIVL